MRLDGKRAVITGGASGQGLATARLFLEEGARVALLDWNEAAGREAERALSASGGDVRYFAVDLRDEARLRAVCDQILAEFGGVDILFNNAGIGYSENARFPMTSLFETSLEDWNAILQINLTGSMLTTKLLGPSMRDQGAGSIIFNASIAGIVGQTNIDAYTASKGALVALTRALAAQLGEHGVRVNAIAPGAIDTPMLKPIIEAGLLEQRLNVIPMRRVGTPEDIAGLALFLASDLSGYVTGQIIACDGGRVAI